MYIQYIRIISNFFQRSITFINHYHVSYRYNVEEIEYDWLIDMYKYIRIDTFLLTMVNDSNYIIIYLIQILIYF